MTPTPQAPPLCRFCRTPLVDTLLDLGRQPLANSYLSAEQLAAGAEQAYPLHVRVCRNCFLVQADDAVPADANRAVGQIGRGHGIAARQ